MRMESSLRRAQLSGTHQHARSSELITLFRSSINGKERYTASADTELQPGDVIEVALRPAEVDIAAQ